MNNAIRDLRIALRNLLRMPQYTLPVLLVLALGLGATAAMVGALRTVMFTDLPYAESQRIQQIWWAPQDGKNYRFPASWPMYEELTQRLHTVSAVAGFGSYRMNVTGDGEPEQALVGTVTPGFFDVFQVQPLLGTVHWAPESPRGVVLTEGFWTSHFARDPQVLSRTLRLNGLDHPVLGVLPGSVSLNKVQLFAPLVLTESQRNGRYNRFLPMFVRLAPGRGPAQFQAELAALGQALASEHPGQQEAVTHLVGTPYTELLRNQNKIVGTILALATGLLVAITLVNLGNAVLARAMAAAEETALRMALGASTWTALRPRLAESLLLAAAGALLGVGVASATLGMLKPVVSAAFQAAHPLAVDAGLLAGMAGASVLVALLMAGLPGLLMSKLRLSMLLNASGRGLARGASRHLRVTLVVAQVALALTLLASFASAQSTLRRLLATNLGLRIDGVAVFTCDTSVKDEAAAEKAARQAEELVARLKTIPGVKQAGSIAMLPVDDWGWNFGSETPKRPHRDDEWVELRTISPEAFEVFGIRLLQGRTFSPSERKGEDSPTALISESLARTFFPGESPLGQTFRYNDRWVEVVGVVSDVRNAGPGSDQAQMVAYFPSYLGMLTTTFVVQFDSTSVMNLNALRKVAREVAPQWPPKGLRPMREVVNESVEGVSIQMRLMGLAGGLALLLALAGLHSLLSYIVAQRTKEFGIRVALGATALQIFQLVLRRGVFTTALGVLIGLGAAFAAGRLLAATLGDAQPAEPTSLVGGALVLLLGASAASLLSAFRAATLPPSDSLRQS
ncbi:ABC transporter permease [Geothrix sp. PMB-07]|uniref:ABC transporter permease n=1 Tax=Geothrix sp. PMB-07 TaxID=3068640 RepID=UPI002740FF6C|nr:ABC transporter permease [Geothrix sp. PMB-07]WLT31880.1 ABC transporter permease [Geothrix sp. PMB-07]